MLLDTIVTLQAVIDAQIIPLVIHLLQTAEFDIQKEAAWAISNATNGGHADQIKYGLHLYFGFVGFSICPSAPLS